MKLTTSSVISLFLLLKWCLVHQATSLSNNHGSKSQSQLAKVAVLGTTGRLGRTAVQILLSRGVPIRCLVRNLPQEESHHPPANDDEDATILVVPTADEIRAMPTDQYLQCLRSLGAELVQGDVATPDLSSLTALVDGCTAVLALYGARPPQPFWKSLLPATFPEDDPAHPRSINYQGVTHLLEACRATTNQSKPRIVRVTGKGEEPYAFFSILINLLGGIAKGWNYEGEQLLRSQNDIPYTIVRPGVMMNAVETNHRLLTDDGQDLPTTPVSYQQIAELCVDCLDYNNTKGATLTAMNVRTKPSSSSSSTTATTAAEEGEETYRGNLLEAVRPDRRTFPGSLIQEHKRGARLGAAVLAVVLTSLGGVVVALLRFLLGALSLK